MSTVRWQPIDRSGLHETLEGRRLQPGLLAAHPLSTIEPRVEIDVRWFRNR